MNTQRWLEALRQGAVDPDHAARLHGGGKGAPDPTQAAIAQGQASTANQTAATYANRPTINTPFGSQSWQTGQAVDPSTGAPVTTWEQNTQLTPESQAALDAQQRISAGRSGAAETLLGQATSSFQTPMNWEGMPTKPGSLGEAQGTAFEKLSANLEPGRERSRASMDTKLANMGLNPGSEAYKRAQADLGEQFATQDKSLLAQAMGEGRSDVAAQQQMRSAAIAEEAQRRGMPLNELNALLTGQQVSMPSMPGFQNAGVAQAPQLLDAAKMKADQGTDYGQLAGTAAMAGAMMF